MVTKSLSSINIPHPTIVTKHIYGFNMTSRRNTMLPFTHEITKTKQTKITKTRKNHIREVGEM
jgi:hypothetical protein